MAELDFTDGDGGKVGRWLATSAAAWITLFAVQVAVGWLLHLPYVPTLVRAYRTVEGMSGTPWGFLANWHFWGGTVLLAGCALHVVAMLWAGWYRPPHVWRWYGSLALALGAFLLHVTGNLLPMDRHGVQTAVIEAGIASRIPLAGSLAAQGVLFGDRFSEATLQGWYLVHRWAIPVGVALGLVGAMLTHVRRRDATEDRRWMWLPTLVSLGLAATVAGPLGTRATRADFAMYDALPGWYTWPLHGALRGAETLDPTLGWLGVAVLPGLFALYLLSLPALSRRLTPTALRLGFGLFAALFFVPAFLVGGWPTPLLGNREARMRPQELPAAAPSAPPVTTIDRVLAARGKEAFAAEGCGACHGAEGRGAAGGPDLTNVHLRHPDADYTMRFIRNPNAVRPGSTMPGNPDMSEDTLRALAEWLRDPESHPR